MTIHREIRVSLADTGTFLLQGARNYAFFSRLPERTQEQGSYATYLSPTTDTTVQVVEEHCAEPLGTLHFTDEAKLVWDSIKLRVAMSEKCRRHAAEYKESKIVPDEALLLRHDPRSSPYQLVASYLAHLSDGFGEFMEQGTGKTLVAINRMSNLPHGSKVLIVVPNQVRINWQKELAKFVSVSYTVRVMRGSKEDRVSDLVELFRRKDEDEAVHLNVGIIGYDAIAGSWDALQMVRWDLVVLDESHMIRNFTTKRWRFIKMIRDTADRRMCLTGTPIANSINDLFTQLEFMGEGYSGFRDFKAFKKFFGVYMKDADSKYETFLGLQNVPIIKDRLSRFTFAITKDEALPDLPEKVYDVEEVEMSPQQQTAYDQLASQLALEIEAEMENSQNQALVVNNVLVQLLKLAQITSGFLNIPAEKDHEGTVVTPASQVSFSPNPKLERLMEILGSKQPHEKTIVWAVSVPSILRIERACATFGIKCVTFYGGTSFNSRIEAERQFNEDDECKVFIGNPGCGGAGLNLLGYPPGQPELSSCNADHAIYFDQDWSSLKRAQSEDRAHRRGTRTNIRVTDLCIPGTIDEQIRERVVEKRIMAFQVADVRDILRQVLYK